MPAKFNTSAFRSSLLRWYRRHYRPLPWRPRPRKNLGDEGQVNPYHVLVSEFMLQQTQVATVIPYFHRFVRALPTVAALARTDDQRVLLLWQGLGYYRRAINLHRAAQTITRDHGGRVPNDLDALLSLPGVGRYTAGAIASIAFGSRVPAVDGNAARVLSRVYGMADADPLRLRELAEALLPARRCGDFNQALMEVGATVCQPRGPQCDVCPVRRYCRGRGGAIGNGRVPKAAPRDVVHHVLAVECGGRYLLQQRRATGLWARLWQMPTIELDFGVALSPDQLCNRFTAILGAAIPRPKKLGQFVHLTSHRRITFALSLVNCPRRPPRLRQWRALDDLHDLPISAAQKRIVGLLTANAI